MKGKEKLHPTNPNGFQLILIPGTSLHMGKFIDSIYEQNAPPSTILVQFSPINETNLCWGLSVASCSLPSTTVSPLHGFSNSGLKPNCPSLSWLHGSLIESHCIIIGECGQIVMDFIPRKDGARLCLDCTQHLAVGMAELFCHFSACAHSSTHWYSCSYYPLQSAAEKL